MITKFDEVYSVLKKKKRKHLVVSCANESHTIGAVHKAFKQGIIDATLVGNKEKIKNICQKKKIDSNEFNIIDEPDDTIATKKSVQIVHDNGGDILMKGLVNSDRYLRAILHKEYGLLSYGAMLSHIAVFDHPNYHKLMFCSDVAIIPKPDLKQKINITNNVIEIAHKFGIEKPKIALISSSEHVIPSMEGNTHCVIIAKMADRGQLKNAYVDGPLALDVALDREAVKIKNLKSDVAGDADGLIFPNLDAGNVFYKSCTKFGNAEFGGIVVGAKKYCVMSSRYDSTKTKLNAIALAAVLTP